jgi:hypothetical protein
MTNVTEMDVVRALDGDRDALTRLVERVRSPVFRLALRFFGNRADAVLAGSIEQARRFPQVLDQIRRLDEAERAGALYRAHPEAHPKADLAGFVRRLFPE